MGKLSSHLLLSVLFVSFIACSKVIPSEEQGPSTGINLNLGLRGISVNQLSEHVLEVRGEDGNVVETYNDLTQLPPQVKLTPGHYEIAVYSAAGQTPQFDFPSFSGEQQVVVSDKQLSDVTVNIEQVNFGVILSYTDGFKAAYSDYSAVVASPDGTLSYSAAETRTGYFFKGPINITFTYKDDQNNLKEEVKYVSANNPALTPGNLVRIELDKSGTGGETYDGYYQRASHKTGLELKNILGDIISEGYDERSYRDLWDIYKKSDVRTDGTIWDMYSDNPNGSNPYEFWPGGDQCGNYSSEGDCYNREHSVPKSWFNDQAPMYTDMVHLVPTDGKVNSMRSNYPFGEVGSVTYTSKNGSKLGNARSGLGYSGKVFEPIDAYKGDFARIYFYFVTRYDDRIASWDNAVFSSDQYGLDRWVINMLLEWHKNDPVSAKEKNRNNYIEQFQNNRNPYVDHPEFVDQIWGQLKAHPVMRNGIIQEEVELKYLLN